MGIGSVILGIFAFLCMFAGVVLVWVPFLGTMLSFLSPILSIAGVILGGVALSRAREGNEGESEGLAIGGLIVNVLAFVPAMLVALTCGLCNTMCTSAFVTPDSPTTRPWTTDAGLQQNPFEALFADDAGVPESDALLPEGAEGATPPVVPIERRGDQVPLPPPPLPPGPT